MVFSDVYNDGQSSEGAAFLWYGGPGSLILSGTPGTPANAEWTAEGNQSGSSSAGAAPPEMSTATDTATSWSDSGIHLDVPRRGRAEVFLGSPGGLETTPAWVADEGQSGAGSELSSAARGMSTTTASATFSSSDYYDNGQTDEGRAYLFLARHGVRPHRRGL